LRKKIEQQFCIVFHAYLDRFKTMFLSKFINFLLCKKHL